MTNPRVLVRPVLCALLVAGQQAAQNQPPRFKAIFEPVNVKADVKLFDAFFASEQAGWLAGGSGEISGGAILYTGDGGKTWTTQYGDFQSDDRAVTMLRFNNAHSGWAVQGTGGEARLLHTSDGQSWNQSGSIPEHVADYAFTSEVHGVFVMGDQIELTEDGGQHWKSVATCNVAAEVNGLTQTVHCGFTAIHFPTPTVGYAVASGGGAGAAFFIFKTVDGGATWQSAVIPGQQDAEDVFFIDASIGFVRTGYPDTGRLFRTTDGGRTFTGVGGATGDRIRFADPGVGWSFHYGKMSYTTSGGDRWTSRSLTFPASVYTFSVASRRRGYVVGAHGMVYRYSIVPVNYSVPNMIDAPMMPGYDLPIAAEVQKLRAPVAALRAKLAGAANAACCVTETRDLQSLLQAFAQTVPPMWTRYRNPNLLLAPDRFPNLVASYGSVMTSIEAFKAAPDAQTASAALAQISSQLDQMVQAASTAAASSSQ
jgi:photosystem II stability/assembly factor-like uncharacterized protein